MPCYEITDFDEFKKLITSTDSPVIVDFYAPWCGPCKNIAPTYEKCSNMEECKMLIFVKVDVDKATDIATFCDVASMPTFIAYYKGKEVGRFSGANIKNLEDMVNKCLALSS
jgi:thioredoxin